MNLYMLAQVHFLAQQRVDLAETVSAALENPQLTALQRHSLVAGLTGSAAWTALVLPSAPDAGSLAALARRPGAVLGVGAEWRLLPAAAPEAAAAPEGSAHGHGAASSHSRSHTGRRRIFASYPHGGVTGIDVAFYLQGLAGIAETAQRDVAHSMRNLLAATSRQLPSAAAPAAATAEPLLLRELLNVVLAPYARAKLGCARFQDFIALTVYYRFFRGRYVQVARC